MIDYCVSAFFKRQEEKIYRVYITDALKAICENTANFAGGSVIKSRYYDLIDRPHKQEEEKSDEEKAQEIIDRISDGLKKI